MGVSHRSPFARLLWMLGAWCLVSACLIGCSREPGPPAGAADADESPPELLEVTAERQGLLFRFRDGDTWATASRIDEVPASARGQVLVVDLTRPPAERGSTRWVQEFDLTSAGAGGRFSGRVVRRAEWEARLAAVEATRPVPTRVVMYSASWCGVCAKARTLLNEQGIAFVEKDIEKDPRAARELSEKAAQAGVRADGVPVFDVGGRLFSGFDPESLLRAIRGGPS